MLSQIRPTNPSLPSVNILCLCGLCDLSVLCESNWGARSLDVTPYETCFAISTVREGRRIEALRNKVEFKQEKKNHAR
jgi:hypothetical protein